MIVFSLILLVLLVFLIIYNGSLLYSVFKGAPYVASRKVVAKELAAVIPADAKTAAELGSGLGHLVAVFLRKDNIQKVYSIDINPVLLFLQKIRFYKDYKSGRLILKKLDLKKDTLPEVDVYYMYLLPKLLETVLNSISETTDNETLVISNGFKSERFKYAKEHKFEGGHFFLYTRQELIPYE